MKLNFREVICLRHVAMSAYDVATFVHIARLSSGKWLYINSSPSIIIIWMKRFSSGGCYADITPKERAIANGQRSFESFLLLQLSSSFLRILAVPNKVVFCNSPVLIVTPSFSSHASNRLLATPRTTSRCLIPHSLPISLRLKVLIFLNLFIFLFIHSVVPGWSYVHYDCLVIFLLNNNNVRSSGLDNMITLDLTFFIFHATDLRKIKD